MLRKTFHTFVVIITLVVAHQAQAPADRASLMPSVRLDGGLTLARHSLRSHRPSKYPPQPQCMIAILSLSSRNVNCFRFIKPQIAMKLQLPCGTSFGAKETLQEVRDYLACIGAQLEVWRVN